MMGLEDVGPGEGVVVAPNEVDAEAEGVDVGPKEAAVLGGGCAGEGVGTACRDCERPQPTATSAVASANIDSARNIFIRRARSTTGGLCDPWAWNLYAGQARYWRRARRTISLSFVPSA